MKKILFILTFCALAIVAPSLVGENSAHAQLRTKGPTAPLPQGQFLTLGVSPKDTLAVSDTIAYIIPVEHTNKVNFYHTFKWTKIGSGTATVDVRYFQSNDNLTYFPVLAGVSMTALVKTFTISTTGENEIDLARDSTNFAGRYLKVQYKTSSTASVSGAILTIIKSYFW